MSEGTGHLALIDDSRDAGTSIRRQLPLLALGALAPLWAGAIGLGLLAYEQEHVQFTRHLTDQAKVLSQSVDLDRARLSGPASAPLDIGQMIDQLGLPDDWTVSVFDAGGISLAVRRPGTYRVGAPVEPDLCTAAKVNGEGVIAVAGPTDAPEKAMVTAYHRSDLSGWTVAVGVPEAQTGPAVMSRRLSIALILALIWSAFAASLILGLGRRVSTAIRALGPAAATDLAPWTNAFAETALVREALDRERQIGLFRDADREGLERRAAFYRTMLDLSTEALYGVDPAAGGKIVFANDAACRALRYGREQLLALSLYDVDLAAKPVQADKEQGGIFVTGARHRRSDGKVCPNDVRVGWAAFDGARIMIRAFHDIDVKAVGVTGLHHAEDMDVALSVFNASKEGIVVTDADNLIIEVNPAFTELTGYSPADVMGQDPRILAAGKTPPEVYRQMWGDILGRGFWQGELVNRAKDGTEFTEGLCISVVRGDSGKPLRHIGMFSDVTQWKRTAEFILRQANYDQLTSLPNRRLFRDRLEHEMKRMDRERGQLALLFIDLDRFKEVNDTMGHDAGDCLLVEAATRMTATVRLSDTVARLGGDEFAIILAGVPSAQLVERIAIELCKALEVPFQLKPDRAHVSASIGITLYPDDSVTVETLMKNADQAMYSAKNLGRNRFCWFTESMQVEAEQRLQLANDLRSAISAGQLQVYYQPIVELISGRVVKAEALLRWNHPVHGMIPPDRFIPIAEETGQITTLGNWVFREAALMVKEWVAWAEARGDHHLAKSIKISINKSPKQFHVTSTFDDWTQLLREIDIDPSHIVIEITESLFLGDQLDMAEKLRRFRNVGMGLSLDDFGTGYSSLGYLKRYEVDYLKMDQSFVRDMLDQPSDRAIAEAILAMAARLDLDVVAEGIETPEQRDFLIEAGCRYGQGYLFWRPMPIDRFRAVILSENPIGLERHDEP